MNKNSNKIKCVKKEFVFKPKGDLWWSKHYAQVPTPLELDKSIRIFYTTRPESVNGNFVSHTSFIDVDAHHPEKILAIHNEPILNLGKRGTFDEFGIMPGSLIRVKNDLFLYYTGWSRELNVPYTTSIGLAISKDNGSTFSKISEGPILSKNSTDPFLINGPYVQFFENKYHMWYSSCYKWVEDKERLDPIYKIKHAISDDGINWLPDNFFCISEKIENEAQNAPTIQFINGSYYMFFCYRKSINFRNSTNGYRLSYAVSKDLINWDRYEDENFIPSKKSDWDHEMQAYPRLINSDNRFLLFYNGNYFGKDGFGYAELEF